ncbi:MAG: sulfite exporter TauE/SafE family protein [Granulosicoccus sp.]
MEIQYLLFVLLGFASSIVSAVFGFGTALIVLAVGSHILPVKEAIVLGTVLFATSTVFKTVLLGKHIDWKVAGTMAVASLPFAYLGASWLTEVPSELLRRSLGVMILLYVVLTLFNLFPKFKIGTIGLIGGSAAYGFVSGLLGSGNLIKAIMFREMSITKHAFVGAMAATSVLSNTAKLSAYAASDLISAHQIVPIIGLVLGAIAAVLIGRKILDVVSVLHFEKGIHVVLVVSALALLF